MTEIEQPTGVELVERMIQKLKEDGHGHLDWDGGISVLGSKDCFLCKPIIEAASNLQDLALFRTRVNHVDPKIQPCEVCGNEHKNYECCDKCNYDTHICVFCGDPLGHSQVSVCYLTTDAG